MQQRCARRGATCTLAAAPTLRSLRERSLGRRLVDLLKPFRDARGREGEPWPRARAEAHGTELAGVLVHPGARLAVEPGDLSGIDKRFGSRRRQAAQPHRESLGEQVCEPVERIVVVGPGISAGQRGRGGGVRGRASLGD